MKLHSPQPLTRAIRLSSPSRPRAEGFTVYSLLWFVVCILFFPLQLDASPSVPEKLFYSVYWAGVKAGNASLEINNNPEGTIITSRATSSDLISIFYRVDNIIQSTLYQNGYPKNYRKKLREGRYRRDREVQFEDKTKGQRIIYHDRLNNEVEVFDLGKHIFDPLSGFYEIRKRQLEVGRSEYIDIFDKKPWNLEVQILKKEQVIVPAGSFNTILIKPLLQSEGIFMRKGEIYIWLTDDERKIPVMLRSMVKIGSITAKLEKVEY